MYLVQEEDFVWMQVLIFHILVARHTDVLEERDGCLIYDTWYVPNTQEREVQLSFYLKILESRLLHLGCRRDYLVLSLVCLSIFFPSDSLVLFLSPPPHVPSLVSLLTSCVLSPFTCPAHSVPSSFA